MYKLGNNLLKLNGSLIKSLPYPTNGLVARWTFQDTLVDGVNGYTLTDVGSDVFYETGKIGKCATKETIDLESLEITDSNFIKTFYDDITETNSSNSVSLWFRRQLTAGLIQIAYTDNGRILFYQATVNRTYFTPCCGQPPSNITSQFGAVDFNVWNHIVLVYNDDDLTYKIYKNNQFIYQFLEPEMPKSIMTFGLLRASAVSGGEFNSIDNVYVYNRALTEAEITMLYKNGKGI